MTMILEYDRSPNATLEQRMNSLVGSIQRAFEGLESDIGVDIDIDFKEAKESKPIENGKPLSEILGQIKKNERNVDCETLKVGNVDYTITDEEFEELYDQVVGGKLISNDFNVWHKANTSNGIYTITNEEGVSVLRLESVENYVGIYAPHITPRKEQLVDGNIVFSIWIKKLTGGTVYPVQFRVMTEATDGKDVAGGGYWTHGFTSSYSNKPKVVMGEWIRYEVRITWDNLMEYATKYNAGFTADTATGLNIRLFVGSATQIGDIVEYKLPCLYLEK